MADLIWLFCGQDEVKVLGRIGEGAFGEVSLATCAIFGKVAVKWLKARAALRDIALALGCERLHQVSGLTTSYMRAVQPWYHLVVLLVGLLAGVMAITA